MNREGQNQIVYQVVRSARKTLTLQIKPDGEIVVKAPLRMSQTYIDQFVQSKKAWISRHLAKLEQRKEQSQELPVLDSEQLKQLTEAAKQYIPKRVQYYAPMVGVDYGKITIRRQKTRWGSCSSQGNLNFNCLLMLAPPEVIDSVVVHELCHRKEMNHSQRFYREVLRVFPQYHQCNQWLKTNGKSIMMRVEEFV